MPNFFHNKESSERRFKRETQDSVPLIDVRNKEDSKESEVVNLDVKDTDKVYKIWKPAGDEEQVVSVNIEEKGRSKREVLAKNEEKDSKTRGEPRRPTIISK